MYNSSPRTNKLIYFEANECERIKREQVAGLRECPRSPSEQFMRLLDRELDLYKKLNIPTKVKARHFGADDYQDHAPMVLAVY
jgi:hypothetical protein